MDWNSILQKIKNLPLIGKILSIIAIIIILVITFFFSSCGTTRVVVRNSADSTKTNITVQTNNPTDVGVSPNISVDLHFPDTLTNNKRK